MKAKKIIIPVSIIAGIAAIGTAVAILSNSAAKVSYADAMRIQAKELENKISVSGTVKSSDKTNVYSKLSYAVEKINVKVGDTVKKGDVLCTISTEELQQQILQQQASVESSGISSDYNLSEAERRYSEAAADYSAGRNTVVVNAQKAVEQAEKSLADAKRQESIGSETTLPSNLQNADTQIKNAAQQVESAKNQLESAKKQLENVKNNYETALKAYNDAEDDLKPENYPGDIKIIYDNIDKYKKYIYNAKYDISITELTDAKNEYERAEKEYYDSLKYNAEAAENGYEPHSQKENTAFSEKYQRAKQKYEEAVEKFKLKNLEEQLTAYENQLENAVDNLKKVRDNAKSALDNAKASVDSAEASVTSAQTALNSAQLSYDKAVSDYESTGKVNENSAEGYSIAVKNAQDALDTAKKDYDLAVRQAEAELASLKKAAEQQRTVSGLNDPQVIILQNLRDKLEYAEVLAPCDGVITAVNAEEGAPAAGVLFTIENLDSLVVSASVGEYDIPYISEGMEAVIRCDALNGEEFGGKISEIAPVPEGLSSNSGTSYKIEATIDSGDSGDNVKLLAGMSAKLNIISERKAGALTVTYDALSTDENGNDVVYIAEKDDTGVYHAKMIKVTVGLETDYEVEVISDELKDGMYVLTNTTFVLDGAVVNINENENSSEAEGEK